MAYRRNWRYNPHHQVEVSLYWSQITGCYALKFDRIDGKWNSVQAIITWLKLTVPSGEREYDDVNKVWFVHEKFFDTIKGVIEANPNFNCKVVEKPVGSSTVQFVPTETYIAKFKELTGEDIMATEYTVALKVYRKASLRLHPDRNGGDGSKMSELNQAWDAIKDKHFKIAKPVMEQVQ